MLPPYLRGDRLVLESISRQSAHAVRLTGDDILCRVLGKYLMVADANDHTVAPHLALDGYWEPWTTLAIARAVPAGARIVDVGANHGYFTLVMAIAAGAGSRVLALEPNPRMADLVRRTLDLNGVNAGAQVHACAAGASGTSRARLVVPAHRSADASLHRVATADDTVIDVVSTSIDELTQSWQSVDFVKIDAEGAEPEIWEGMARTLERNPRITVVLEFKRGSYANAGRFLASIIAGGFRLRCIEDDGTLRPVSEAEALDPAHADDWMLFLNRD